MPSSSVGLGKVPIVLIHYMVMGGGVGEGRVSYPISGWPGAHYVVQADLEHEILPCQLPEQVTGMKE